MLSSFNTDFLTNCVIYDIMIPFSDSYSFSQVHHNLNFVPFHIFSDSNIQRQILRLSEGQSSFVNHTALTNELVERKIILPTTIN